MTIIQPYLIRESPCPTHLVDSSARQLHHSPSQFYRLLSMAFEMTTLLCRILQHLLVAYPLLLCLLRPAIGLSYLDPFFGTYRCTSSQHDNLRLLLPMWMITAFTGLPILISAHEAVHEFASNLSNIAIIDPFYPSFGPMSARLSRSRTSSWGHTTATSAILVVRVSKK